VQPGSSTSGTQPPLRNSLAALVARRPGVVATLLSAIDFADLPGEDEGFTPLTDTELVGSCSVTMHLVS
jgi:hypothetical protein